MTDTIDWDGAVDDVLRKAGFGPHPNAAAMAWAIGLQLRPRAMLGARLRDHDVYYDRRLDAADQHKLIAECVAEYALQRRGLEPTPAAIRHVATRLTERRRWPRHESGVGWIGSAGQVALALIELLDLARLVA